MKIKMIVFAGILAVVSICRADLIYLEDLAMVDERTTLGITFEGAADTKGKIDMKVQFGHGPYVKSATVKVALIKDPEKFRATMEKLLKTLNDPKNAIINLQDAMKQAGFGELSR
jgi:hypothetical protein